MTDEHNKAMLLNKLCLIAVFFMMTMISFYFSGAAIFSVLGFLLFVFIMRNEISINPIYFLLVIVFSLSAFVGIVNFGEIKLTNLFGFILSISIFILFTNLKKASYLRAIKAIEIVIYIHLLFFFIQFFLYYIFGVAFSYLELFGLESRNFDGSREILNFKAYRASGLFEEPSTFIAVIYLLYVPIARKTSHTLAIIIVITGFCTLSSLGVLLAIIVIISFLFNGGLLQRVSLFLVSIVPFFAIVSYQMNRLLYSSGEDDPLSIRMRFINLIFERDWTAVFLGNGLGTFDTSSNINNDLGMVPILFYLMGGLSLPFIVLVLKGGRIQGNFILTLGLLMLKVPIYYPLFWVLIFFNNLKERDF